MATADDLYNEHDQLKAAGKLEEAIAKLEEGLKLEPTHVMSHLGLAVLCQRVGRFEDSVKHGEEACKIDPNDAFNFTAMSVTYQRAYAGTGNQAYIRMAEDAMAKAHLLQGHQH